jgi:hypothetical protein
MYCVVETLEDGKKICTAVPRKWVIDNNLLLWSAKASTIISGRKLQIEPRNNWLELPCKILFDNIGKLRSILYTINLVEKSLANYLI